MNGYWNYDAVQAEVAYRTEQLKRDVARSRRPRPRKARPWWKLAKVRPAGGSRSVADTWRVIHKAVGGGRPEGGSRRLTAGEGRE